MRKKIALVLVMVMFVNMVVWADGYDAEQMDGTMLVLLIVAIVVVTAGTIWLIADADAPDDGIRLASLSNENPIPGSGFGSFLKALNYVEIGQPQNDKIYLGLRFRF